MACSTLQMHAQQNAGMGIAYGWGSIRKHTPKIYYDPPKFSQDFEISYCKKSSGKKEWERRYGLPYYSFSLVYNDYHNEVMKGSIAFLPIMQFELLRYKPLTWYWRMGYGVAYAFKHWQRIPLKDTLNNYLGSAINMYAYLQSGLQYSITKKLNLKLAYSLSHVSNGGTKSPNYGVNLFVKNVGIDYYFLNNRTDPLKDFSTKRLEKSISKMLDIKTAIAYSESPLPDGPIYPNYNITVCPGVIINHKHKLFAGVDLNYSRKATWSILNTFATVNNRFISSSNVAICAGDELLIGKFGVPLQYGYYLYNPYGPQYKAYQKIGLYYYVVKNTQSWFKDVYIGSIMKSHNFTADYVEFSLGTSL